MEGRSAVSDLHISAFSTKNLKCRWSLVSTIASQIANVKSSDLQIQNSLPKLDRKCHPSHLAHYFQGWLSQILWRLVWDPSYTKGRIMQSCTWETSVCFENHITEKAIYLKPTSSFIQADFRIQCLEFLGEHKNLGEDFFLLLCDTERELLNQFS